MVDLLYSAQCEICVQVPSPGVIASADMPIEHADKFTKLQEPPLPPSAPENILDRYRILVLLLGRHSQQHLTGQSYPYFPCRTLSDNIPQVDGYEVTAQLGKGGGGEVFRALVLDGSGLTVALKSIFLDQHDQREKTEKNLHLHEQLKDHELQYVVPVTRIMADKVCLPGTSCLCGAIDIADKTALGDVLHCSGAQLG